MFRKQRLYLQVAEVLKDHIFDGIIKPGEKLKSEAQLCDEFGVSRATIREALGHLESQALITRKHGIGSFVLDTQEGVVAGLETLESYIDTVRRSGQEASEHILSITKIRLEDAVAAKMETDSGAVGYEVKTVRFADGIPVNYSVDILSHDIIQDANLLCKRRDYETLLDFLSEELSVFARYALMYLNAIEASAEVASILKVPQQSPVLYLDGVVRQSDGTCIYHSSNYFVTARYRFSIVRRR
ncbi:MAG TPA: GntR family transcriptional regulator [bacterium]|nr:GntR family transcriptional regulator [bacterium]